MCQCYNCRFQGPLFCMKVESFLENGLDDVSFQKQKIRLSYNLTKNSFIVENHKILENDIFTKETDVETTYTVNGFRCNTTSYEAEQEPYPILTENHVISICIRSDNDSAGRCQVSR